LFVGVGDAKRCTGLDVITRGYVTAPFVFEYRKEMLKMMQETGVIDIVEQEIKENRDNQNSYQN
jgi:hypothetical protein